MNVDNQYSMAEHAEDGVKNRSRAQEQSSIHLAAILVAHIKTLDKIQSK